MNPRSARSIHLWVSVLLALPMLIVALTAILIAHDKALGLKEIQLPAAWVPGGAKAEEAELRAYWPLGDAAYLGGKGGLLRQQGAALQPVEGLRGDVRALLGLADGTVLAAGQRGLYRVQGLQAERLLRGDFWTLSRQPDGSLLAVGKEGKDGLALRSTDGQDWQPTLAPELQQLAALQPAPQTVSLGKLVMDLHTGKAFFGKRYEWIWIDLLGATLALLGLTGLWMWWRAQRRQASIA